jgi:hypothetical protein
MSFTADLSKFCLKEAPQWIDGVTRKVVIEVGNRAVMRSPVGDADYWINPAPPGYVGGRFRANWQYGFASAPPGVVDAVDPSGGMTIANIVADSTGARGVHYVVNNLPYAQRIEDGWSRQAPTGIVSLLELEFPEIVRRAK